MLRWALVQAGRRGTHVLCSAPPPPPPHFTSRALSSRWVSTTSARSARNDGNTLRPSRGARKTQSRRWLKKRAEFSKHPRDRRPRPHPDSSEAPAYTAATIRNLPEHSQQRALLQAVTQEFATSSGGRFSSAGSASLLAANSETENALSPVIQSEDMDVLVEQLGSAAAAAILGLGGKAATTRGQGKIRDLMAMDTDKRMVDMNRNPDLLTTKYFNELIRAQAVQDRADAAFRTYERMLLMDVQPNRHTYWAVLYACARSGNADVAETVVDQLAAAAGGPVHRSFYTQLAQAYVTADRLEDAFKVIKTLEDHTESKRLRYALAQMRALPGGKDLDEEKTLRALGLDRPEGHGAVDVEPALFTALIKGCVAKGDYARAFSCFDRMQTHYADPDAHCLGLMISVCARTGEPERALDLWNEFALLDLQPTLACYNAIIHALARSWRYAPKAFDFYFQLRAAGYLPTEHTLNTLLHSCSHSGDVRRATVILNTMKESRTLQPTSISYATYLNVLARAQTVRDPSPTLASQLESDARKAQQASLLREGPNRGLINSSDEWSEERDGHEGGEDQDEANAYWESLIDADATEDDLAELQSGDRLRRQEPSSEELVEQAEDPHSETDAYDELEDVRFHDDINEEDDDALEALLQGRNAALGDEQDSAPDNAVIAALRSLDNLQFSGMDDDEADALGDDTMVAVWPPPTHDGGSVPAEFLDESDGDTAPMARDPAAPMTLEVPRIGRATVLNLNIQLAWRTFQECLHRNIPPSQDILNSLLRVHAEATHVSSALEIIDLFSRYNVPRTAHTYGTVVGMLVKAKQQERAAEWKAEMLAEGFTPSSVVYGKLLHAAACRKDVAEVLQLLDEREDVGVELPAENYLQEVRRLLKQKRIRRPDSLPLSEAEFERRKIKWAMRSRTARALAKRFAR